MRPWRNQIAFYDSPPPLTLRRRFWLCWLAIEGRLFPRFHARRYSVVHRLKRL